MFAFLERLLFFFFVVTAIRSVVMAVRRAFRGVGRGGRETQERNAQPRGAPTQNPGGPSAADSSPSTILHQDPVCGTYVAAGGSLRKIVRGKVWHFCSDECRDRYAG